jgi:hypothetical protein
LHATSPASNKKYNNLKRDTEGRASERDSSGAHKVRVPSAKRAGMSEERTANSPTQAQKNSRSRKTARLFFCSEAARQKN